MAKSKTYEEFTEKFKPKKTTDDCYTPPAIYEVVADYVAEKYGLDKSKFVRPFWPGADYKAFDYKEGDIVVDNPPFSILAKIVHYYEEREIKYFLFAPSMTCFNTARKSKPTILSLNASITYENGAKVPTSFLTNLEKGIVVKSEPRLFESLKTVSEQSDPKANLPIYKYPDNIITASVVSNFSKYGIDFSVKDEECVFIGGMDAQKKVKKQIFGHGFLVSDKKVADKKVADKKIADKKIAEREIIWELSERERGIIEELNKKNEIIQ